MDKTSLGDRMKNNYENISRHYLTRRTPVIIRIDGKAFHTFTNGFSKPFDMIFVKSMQDTTRYLCENIQGCKIGYVQSDEISLLLTDFDSMTTDAWFGYNIQKMTSVSASMATMAFNKFFAQNVTSWIGENRLYEANDDALKRLSYFYLDKAGKAMFDARCFNIPKEEVCNYYIWRQQDAVRNSIQSVGQANFSHKQLEYKTCNNIQDMLMIEKGINWNDFDTTLKRGSCCIRSDGKWIIDNETPTFTHDRDYIENVMVAV